MKKYQFPTVMLLLMFALSMVGYYQLAIHKSNAAPVDTIKEQVKTQVKKGIQAIQPYQELTPAPPLVVAARQQIGVTVHYDPAYVGLEFPMGDVPMDRGVCTDVVVRAYRKQGKDLQALVNGDMKKAWSHYPKIWGLKTTDKNIDHRRVPNLRVFFKRHGKSLKVSDNPKNYQAGDLVTWKVQGLPHIGIVSNRATQSGTPLIIHNIGAGTQENDILFRYPITGHYRYQ